MCYSPPIEALPKINQRSTFKTCCPLARTLEQNCSYKWKVAGMDVVGVYCATLKDIEHNTLNVQFSRGFIQIYATLRAEEIPLVLKKIQRLFPNVLVVGMSVPSFTIDSQVHEQGIGLLFCKTGDRALRANFLEVAKVDLAQEGQTLFSPLIQAKATDIICLADNLLNSDSAFFASVKLHRCRLTGGIAGQKDGLPPWVCLGTQVIQQGAVVLGMGEAHGRQATTLNHLVNSFSNWSSIGKSFQVTKTLGSDILELDHTPTVDIYRSYLGSKNEMGFTTYYEFGLEYERDGNKTIAIPVEELTNGGLAMSQPIQEGTSVKFAFCHSTLNHHQIRVIAQELMTHNPHSILVFDCIARLKEYCSQKRSDLEILGTVAPVHGPFCHGEIFGLDGEAGVQYQSLVTYIEFPDAHAKASAESELDRNRLTPIFNLIKKATSDLEMQAEMLEKIIDRRTRELLKSYRMDSVTGLANQGQLHKDLKSTNAAIEHLCIVRLRNLRELNERYGFKVADKVLVQLVQVIEHSVATTLAKPLEATTYRVSASEIAIALSLQTPLGEVERLLQHISVHARNKSYHTGPNPEDLIIINISIGCASRSRQSEHLLVAANNACRRAYRDNLPVYIGYSNDTDTQKLNLDWLTEIKLAYDHGRVFCDYQPVIHASKKSFYEAEALLRVRIQDKVVLPDRFLDSIKRTRLYPEITLLVLKYCSKLLTDFPNTRLAMNLSVFDIYDQETYGQLYAMISQCDFANRLTLEITETDNIVDYNQLIYFLNDFRKLGCRVAIDDFGSGYSNLEKIIELNPDILKFDGSLIRSLDTNAKMRTMVGQMVKLSHSLNIRTQAEYVHSQEICQIVTDMGMDYLQGFYISKPVSSTELVSKWIKPKHRQAFA